MKRLFFLCLLFTATASAFAGTRDSLIIHTGPQGWHLLHEVLPGESILSISRRYHVPYEILASTNRLQDGEDLSRISSLRVPLDDYNILRRPPRNADTARPLYYRVQVGDNIYRVTGLTGVSQEQLIRWNGPIPGDLLAGMVLLVAWVRYEPTSIMTGPAAVLRSEPGDGDEAPEYVSIEIDSARVVAKSDIPPTLEQLWREQTVEGQNMVTEKGTAGFFNISGKAAGAGVFAFHNAAARGTVMRVRNINNDRVIYVKVLGPLPETKQYAGCVLGLSNRAKAALGVQETKAFCEMSYAGY